MLNLPNAGQPTMTNRKARRAEKRKQKKASHTATAADPNQRLLEKGVKAQRGGRLDEAEQLFKQVTKAAPDNFQAWFLIGDIYYLARQKPEVGYGYYKKALTLNGEDLYCWRQFGRCLRDLEQYPAAVIAQKNALRLAPNDPSTLVDLAWALHSNDQGVEALTAFDQAVKLAPDDVFAQFGKAKQYETLGDADSARREMLRVLEIDDAHVDACFTLVHVTRDQSDLEQILCRISELIEKKKHGAKEAATLHFALAKGRQRQKRHDEAFEQYARANGILHETFPANLGAMETIVETTIQAFQPEVLDTLAQARSETDAPVFIIGMPRSGSTLVEQILASHPDVSSAGEFSKFGHIVELLSTPKDGGLCYPQDIAHFPPESLRDLGSNYLAALQQQSAREAARITDKRLTNFFQVGLLTILFPNARIIHCRRDPMDTCLSCYFQNFVDVKHLAYTHDLEDLGTYYRQYERLMDHWRTLLPNRMFELDYEDLIADQEATSRKLIEHLGLPWDDACLEFHTSTASVRTASMAQVRQPIYKSSVAAWKQYEEHLGPLKQALRLEDR